MILDLVLEALSYFGIIMLEGKILGVYNACWRLLMGDNRAKCLHFDNK